LCHNPPVIPPRPPAAQTHPKTRPNRRRRFYGDPGGGFRGTASHSRRRRRSGGSPRPSGRSFRPAGARRPAPAPGPSRPQLRSRGRASPRQLAAQMASTAATAAESDPPAPRRQADDPSAPRRRDRRRRHLPGGAGRTSPVRAAPATPRRRRSCSRPADPPDTFPRSDPPFQFFPPNPPSPRLRRLPAPGLAGSDFSPVRFIAGGKTRKEGSDGYIHAPTATPPLRGRGNGRRIRRENRRSPLQSEQPRRQRPPRPRSGWPLSPRGRRTSTARDRFTCPAGGVAGLHPVAAGHPVRFKFFSRPPRTAPLRALRPRASPFTYPMGRQVGPRPAHGPRHRSSFECMADSCASASGLTLPNQIQRRTATSQQDAPHPQPGPRHGRTAKRQPQAIVRRFLDGLTVCGV